MGVLKKYKNSIRYILFEGLSKGGGYLLLLFVATTYDNGVYISLMLLFSAETLLKMLFVTYYGEPFFKPRNEQQKKSLFDSYILISLIQSVIYLLLGFFFLKEITTYFDYQFYYSYLAIFINAVMFNYFRLKSIFYQVSQNHDIALLYKSWPFFCGFLFSFLFFLFLEDTIFAFFFGKTVGFSLFFIADLKRKKGGFNTKGVNFDYSGEILKRSALLCGTALLGWVSGIGFMNFAKLFIHDPSELLELGYVLNIYSILLLFAYGINQIYGPRLKNIVENNTVAEGVVYSKRVQLLYVSVSALLIIFHFLSNSILSTFLEEELIPSNVLIFWNTVPWAIGIFFFSSLAWVASPFYYIFDKYASFLKITVLGFFLAFLCSFIVLYKGYFLAAYLVMIAIKCSIVLIGIVLISKKYKLRLGEK